MARRGPGRRPSPSASPQSVASTARKGQTAEVVPPKAPQPRPGAVELLPTWHYGVPAVVALVTLVVYAMTTARDITVGDNPEFVAAALTLGVGHPPGYPLATILGHLFSYLPIGPDAFRVNLLAAVSGAAASGVIALTALKLTRNVAAAAVAGLALAADPLFWRWSLEAEAFPLNNIIVSVMLYLLVSWYQRPQDSRWLVAAAFTGGLGMANHHTIVLLGPAVLFILVRRFSYLLARPGTLVACAAAVGVGMLPYLYIGWAAARDPFFNWGDIGQTKDLIGLFLRRDYGTGQLVAGPAEAGSPVDRLRALVASFTIIEGVLLTAGAVQAYRTHRWYFLFALLAFLPTGPAFAAYANIDVSQSITLFVLERFFLLPHVVVAPLAAFGVVGLAEGARRLVPEHITVPLPLGRGIAAVAVAVIVAGAVTTYPTVDLHDNHLARTYAEDVLASLPQDAIFLADGDYLTLPIAYLQAVEGARPDVRLVYFGIIKGAKWYIDQLRRRDPNLVIPFDRYDRRAGHLKQFADANAKRPLAAFVGPALDFQNSYWYLRTGLVDQVLPMAKDVEVTTLKTENDRIFAGYRPPDPATVRRGTFEEPILRAYGLAAKRVGDSFKDVKMNDEARSWYQRAERMHPGLIEATQALEGLDR